MRHEETTLITQDGLELYAQTWLPDGAPKGVVAFSHGQSDHGGRFAHVGQALADAGYGFHMADLRGHGKSPGPRGHIMSFDEYLMDFEATLASARKLAPDARQFFGGHSLGGTIALNYALQNPEGYVGVVVSAPWLRLAFQPPGWKVALGRAIAGVIPGLTMGNELNPVWLSHDLAIVDAYRNDPLVHGKISARAYVAITAAAEYTLAHPEDLRLPALVMHGAEDPLVSCEASRSFVERANASNCRFIAYEEMYHEILNEIGHKTVIRDLIAWLDGIVP